MSTRNLVLSVPPPNRLLGVPSLAWISDTPSLVSAVSSWCWVCWCSVELHSNSNGLCRSLHSKLAGLHQCACMVRAQGCADTYTCRRAHAHAHTHTHAHAHTYAHPLAHMHIHTVHIHTHTHMHAHTHMHTRMYAHMQGSGGLGTAEL